VTPITLKFGASASRQLLILPALFEEANRMRRFTVQLMRALEMHDIGSTLVDLPGQGEDSNALADVTVADWQQAVDAVAATLTKPLSTVAIRGGALLDRHSDRRWRLAPDTGARLLRDLVRATAMSSGSSASELDTKLRMGPIRLAGNLISPTLYTELLEADLKGDARTPDLSGKKLWRSAEPDDDPALVDAALADIREWLEACGA
jgi:hypothetical protein